MPVKTKEDGRAHAPAFPRIVPLLLASAWLATASHAASAMQPLIAADGLWSLFIGGGDPAVAYASIAIVQPRADQTIFDNNGKLDVDVRLSPPLAAASRDRIILVIDGKQVAAQRQPHFELGAIDRGSHTLQALVITADGRTAIATPEQQFVMWHASERFPNRKDGR